MNGVREIFIFPVQLITSRFGNLTRLILILAICDDHAYIHTAGVFYYTRCKKSSDFFDIRFSRRVLL